MATANGKVKAAQEISIYLDVLDLTIQALVLPDVPMLLSLGELNDAGYSFKWARKKNPVLESRRRKVICDTQGPIPVLYTSGGKGLLFV